MAVLTYGRSHFMLPKPKQLTPGNAARFRDPDLVDFYHLRLPYPEQTFAIVAALIGDEPRVTLDAGAGTGDIARCLAGRIERVDAVDFSAAMIKRCKRRRLCNYFALTQTLDAT